MNNIVKINARKYDGTLHRSWNAQLIERNGELFTFVGEFEKEVNHQDLGKIPAGTISYEYYWLDRWYNIFRFHEPNGDFRNFYCNVNMPPTFENNILDYVDLDIDVLVGKDLKYKVLDLDEFTENSKIYDYGTEIIEKSNKSLSELIRMIGNNEFPFDRLA